MDDDPFAQFPVLTTERLVLRAFRGDDAPGVFAQRSDPEGVRYTGKHPYKTIAEAHTLIRLIDASYAERAGISWVITRAGDDEFMGEVCHHRWVRDHHRAEMGYSLRREHWGHGYAVEALRAIVDWGFARMGLHGVEAQIDPQNAASIRVIERLGFVREGHLRENFFFDGRYYDTFVYSLLRKAP